MSESMNDWVGLRLDPLDVLFFRDGRPFGATNRVSGGLPNPQTLAGALRTALLANWGHFNFRTFAEERKNGVDAKAALQNQNVPEWISNAQFRGPWLAWDKTPNEPLLPVPALLTRDKLEPGKSPSWYRKCPLPANSLPGWQHDDLLPLWKEEGGKKTETPDGYLTLAGIKRFLENGKPEPDDFVKTEQLFDRDFRIGNQIDSQTLTAVDAQLYGISFLALNKDVCLYAQMMCSGSDIPPVAEWLPTTFPFGGEGKYVEVKPLAEPALWPECSASNHRSFFLLATPAFVANGTTWPAGLVQNVKAAASGNPLVVSGWDVARGGPQPTRFAVPAGSVYFVEGELSPKYQSLCTDPEHVAQGWGFALRGVWNDE